MLSICPWCSRYIRLSTRRRYAVTVFSEAGHRHFVDEVRRSARLAGLPLAKVADRAGISRGYLWHLLAGKSSPTLETVFMLAYALEREPRLLLPPGSIEGHAERLERARRRSK